MFQKPAFGSNTSGFGSFNSATTAASPFGGFKPTTGTSAFGAPAFGATTSTQPATGGGLFGASSTSGGLFGSNTPTNAAPAFGASTSSFGFGANTSSGGLFGANNTSTGLFGATQNNSAFGAKPAGFSFGSTATTGTTGGGGLFGSNATTGGGLFGQQNNTMSGGGLFSNTTGAFGQQQTASGTAHVKYNPVVGTDVVVKSGTSQNVNIKHHCITCMKEYENKSLEELRLEDYTAGRKGASGGGVFAFQQQQEAKPLFGASTFGQPATTSAPSVFGGGNLTTNTAFGQPSTFSFGSNTQNTTNTNTLFGANKPAFGATATTGTGLFGAATTQASTFGATSTPSFGFGSNTQTQQSGGLFGAKPATTGFGAPAASTSFGGFGSSGGLFGAKPAQTAAPAFGTTTPAFGSLSGGFGTTTSTSGGLFGASNTFGKPATSTPSFGFNTQPNGLSLGGGLGANNFQAKPAAPAFGTMFQQPATSTTFKTGNMTITHLHPERLRSRYLCIDHFNKRYVYNESGTRTRLTHNAIPEPYDSLGAPEIPEDAALPEIQDCSGSPIPRLDSGLGTGMFGGTPSLGSSGFGLGGLNANTSTLSNNTLSGASVGGNVHEQILTLAARPYGDSPLLKNVLPMSETTAEDVLKPTNPAAVKAVLDSSCSNAYRVSSPTEHRLKVEPRAVMSHDKKSLFDGLEESDASLEDKFSLKPSRKRLVLRPNQRSNEINDSNEHNSAVHNRSIEEQPQRDTNSSAEKQPPPVPPPQNEHTPARRVHYDSNELDASSDRHGSWLSSSKFPWGDKEKPLDGDPSPRLYPNLEKELPAQMAERRASWLTTKPLRKAPLSNPDLVENSVRELGVRADRLSSHDKENVDRLSVSEEEHVAPRDAPPHPTGIKLTRPGYYTIPSLDEMINYMRPDGSCVVPHLTIGRKNYGNVYYDCEIDVAGLNLDALVHFLNKEVIVYPEDGDKPPVGEGLNRRAIVTLDRIWPRDKTEKRPITDPQRLLKMDYEGKLRRVCDKHDTKFIEYRPQTGSWVFRVEHFSKYGLTDSDEEDDPTPDVLKRQLVNQSLQKAAAPAPKPPVPVTSAGLGGLGSSNLSAGLLATDENLFAMHQTSLNLLNGAGKAFDMDTTEDNTESQSLYQDSHRAYGVKSPTSELARLENRQSHNVQLMKASLYADAEMEDDISVSTGDQQVPRASSMLSIPLRAPSVRPTEDHDRMEITPPVLSEEMPMRPLIVRPHTIVLKYHRKVPPFKQTIAGRLDASYIADMSICRARHTRVGFGPKHTAAFTSTYSRLANLPNTADLSDLGRYVGGRTDNDWSEPVVTTLAICKPENDTAQDILARDLSTLLQYSTSAETSTCPRFYLQDASDARRSVLLELKQLAQQHTIGGSSSYCSEVWSLCEALWGADLENDGVPGTDEQSIVLRHRKFLEWLTAAVADVTDQELSKLSKGEDEDEADGHSTRVWTLLLGGRVLEACKVCREHGDLNMAALIAQAAGDPTVRSLISRQISLWKECGADTLISKHKMAILQLISGHKTDKLLEVDWLRALHATARYLCPQVPSLEKVIRTYESFFVTKTIDDEPIDLSSIEADEMGMKFPIPTYMMDIQENEKQRRVLDLRYELIRARAFNTRPKLQPAQYTPNPMDYSLCYLLGAWFGNPTIESITGFADQLEAYGSWHLAVQTLTHHPNDIARGHLIRGVLSRHAPARADSPELKSRLELIRRLGVPEKWLLLAQAHRAKYEHLPALEVEHLVGCGEWNAAHTVALEQLLPTAVLADDVQSIAPLLEKMNEAASRHEIHGWETGGQALYHYLHVCDEIRGLVCSAEVPGSSPDAGTGVQARLEALRPALAAACRSLRGLKTKSARESAARAEMGARLVQLALAAGEPARHLAAMLAALRLPPDCTAHAHNNITTDLAEQASELCIESTNSPPSHQRAINS